MSLLTAILTAAVTAIFGVPFRYYQCWLSWNWLGANLGLGLYFALAGGGGGFLAWLAAEAASVHPTPYPAADGVFYGLIAGAALRVDISARPGKSAQDHYREAASILTKCLTWTSSALDDITARRIEHWLSTLPRRTRRPGAARQGTHQPTAHRHQVREEHRLRPPRARDGDARPTRRSPRSRRRPPPTGDVLHDLLRQRTPTQNLTARLPGSPPDRSRFISRPSNV